MPLPVNECFYRIGQENLSNKMHFHAVHHEIFHVIRGTGSIIIDNHPYPILPDHVYCIAPMLLHFAVISETDPLVMSRLSFSYSELIPVLSALHFQEQADALFRPENGACISLSREENERIDDCFLQLSKIKNPDTETATAQQLLLIAEILTRCCNCRKEQFHEQKTSLAADLISTINFHISSPSLNLDMLSKEHFVSKYYLCRAFKKETGITIMNYVLKQRLALSKALLIHSDRSCSDIAMSAGFSGFSYFSRIFKQHEGLSPLAFRKKYQMLSGKDSPLGKKPI